jgi:hypothetical protein
MKKILIATLTAALISSPLVAHSASTPRPKLNAACTKVYQVVSTPTTSLRCENTASGKKVWRTYKKPTVLRASAKTKIAAAQLPTIKPVSMQLFSSDAQTVAFSEDVASPAPEQMAAVQAQEFVYPIVADPENGGSPEVVEVDPATTEQPNPALPGKVNGFTLNSLSENTADFSFTPVAGVSLYQVYVRYGDSFTLKGVDASNPEVSFGDLTADWNYTACVYYFLNSVESEKSCISFHTPGVRPAAPVLQAGPTAVSATATETTVTVNWSAVPEATSYSICHVRADSMQCGGYTMLSETSAIFQDGSISAGWDYKVKVQAVFADGSRSLESQTTVRSLGSRPTVPAKLSGVTNFRVVAVTPTSATGAWDYSGSSEIAVWGVTARHLTSYTSIGVDPSAREFTIVGLGAGLGYEFTIEGRTGSNVTETSSTNALLPNS